MKFITNASKYINEETVSLRIGRTVIEVIAEEKRFREGLVTGSPKETEKYTSEELERMGLIGLYRR